MSRPDKERAALISQIALYQNIADGSADAADIAAAAGRDAAWNRLDKDAACFAARASALRISAGLGI